MKNLADKVEFIGEGNEVSLFSVNDTFFMKNVFLFKEHEISALRSIELVDNEGFMLGKINIIFCSDDYLLSINKAHLNHDFYTDIITFSFNKERN